MEIKIDRCLMAEAEKIARHMMQESVESIRNAMKKQDGLDWAVEGFVESRKYAASFIPLGVYDFQAKQILGVTA